MAFSSPRTIFRAPHSGQTILSVVYRRDADDGAPRLDVLINGVSTARFVNPAGVTEWFRNSSIKNLVAWQNAYHQSGLTGADFKVAKPVGLDVVLDVPHYSQRDNERHPGGTCNVTSYAMVMAFYDVARRKINGKIWAQREDELSAFLEANGRSRHNHEDLAWMGRFYGLDARVGTNRTWEQIRAEIRAGNPVIVSGLFTSAGHIIVLRGTLGEDFLVNDPWGDARTHYNNRNGKNLRYDFDYLERVVRDAPDSKWAHFVRRGEA